MQLYIKQKILSIGDKYNVYNEKDEIAYSVKSKIISPFRHKKTLMDKDGKPVMIIKRKILDILPNYLIETPEGEKICRMQKRFSLRASFNIKESSKNYSIRGDIFAWDWKIYEDEKLIGTVAKKIIHIVDSYYLDIVNDEDAPLFVAFVIAIDNLMHNGSNSGN